MELQLGKWGQRELAHTQCSMILQTCWSKYGSEQVNKENILKAWPVMYQSCKATGNFKLLGSMSRIIKKLRAGIIPCNDSWFYAFLLMVEREEIRGIGFRRQRYVNKRPY